MNSAFRSLGKFGIVVVILFILAIFGWWRAAVGLVLFFAGFPPLVFGGLAVCFMAVELKKSFEVTLPFKMLLMAGMAALGILMMFGGVGLITHDVASFLH